MPRAATGRPRHSGAVTRRTELDSGLGEVFRVGDARRLGATPNRLRAGDLARPFHGVRTRGDVEPLRAFAPRLRPGDRFSHTTAARLWGAPVPSEHESGIHVSTAVGARARTRGCVGHISRDPRWVMRHGLPASTPAQVVVECATQLPLDALVALCDHLVLDPRVLDPADIRPHVGRAALGEELARLRGLGVRKARRAYAECRDGAESPMETRLRLLVTRAGLPDPVCGFELTRPGGRSVGWFDLAWPEHRVIAEYDGDQHRTSSAQYEKDIRRFDSASELGWTVIRVRRRGVLTDPSETIARVRRALR